MPHGGFSGSLTSPKFDFAVDMGHPFLNRTVDGFIRIGAVYMLHLFLLLLQSINQLHALYTRHLDYILPCHVVMHAYAYTIQVGGCKVAAEETFECLQRG